MADLDVLHYGFVGGKIKVRMYGMLRQLCFMRGGMGYEFVRQGKENRNRVCAK